MNDIRHKTNEFIADGDAIMSASSHHATNS